MADSYCGVWRADNGSYSRPMEKLGGRAQQANQIAPHSINDICLSFRFVVTILTNGAHRAHGEKGLRVGIGRMRGVTAHAACGIGIDGLPLRQEPMKVIFKIGTLRNIAVALET
jgi:hypothetical protein